MSCPTTEPLRCLARTPYTSDIETAKTSSPPWFTSGDAMFAAMLAAIDAATTSISLETYTFAASPLGKRFRAALIEAARRGVRVRVLVDAVGSLELSDSFWEPLRLAGAGVRVFNPLSLGRLGIRNHRKLLACDGREAFIGGFNLAANYEGDGVTRGWRDLGLRLTGTLVAPLEASFAQMFALSEFRHKYFPRLRKTSAKQTLLSAASQLLLCGPGRGRSPLLGALHRDLRRAAGGPGFPSLRAWVAEKFSPAGQEAGSTILIIVPYFLPPRRLRVALQQVARRGGRVQLILPGKSDVLLSQLAGRSYYQRLLRAGVEVYEYQPQVLHAKLFIMGDAVYVGSANLDPRSLHLNYELMVRFATPVMVAEASAIFADILKQCRRIEAGEWRKSRSFWTRWQERWAHFLLARVDPYLALRQWRRLPD